MTFLSFIETVLKLKDLKRTGWAIRDVKNPESVASHSFNVSLLCLLFAGDEKLNTERCIKLAIVHDLHESISGDLVLKDYSPQYGLSPAEKSSKEKNSAETLFNLIPSKKRELQALLAEFFECNTPEAIFVRDMDYLEACLQAFYYEKHNRCHSDLSEFFINAKKKLRTKTVRKLFSLIEQAHRKLLS